LNPLFAVIVPVGPGRIETARLVDLLDSLHCYEGRASCRIYLLEDGADLRPILAENREAHSFQVVSNPRKGRGDAWAGRLTVGILTAYKRVLDDGTPFDFLLRLDTDALVIGPFSDSIHQILQQSPSVGVIGSVRYSREPERVRQDTAQLAKAIDKLTQPFTLWRRTPAGRPFLQTALLPSSRMIRNIILQARSCGYRVGYQCCGGALALPLRTLSAFKAAGFLQHRTAWLRTPLPDDFVLALMVKACGLEIKDCSDPGQPFAVRYQGLPDSPENLANAGYAIIHSVKDRGDLTEDSIRTFFRRRRASADRPPPIRKTSR
jgi:hypothetical protein